MTRWSRDTVKERERLLIEWLTPSAPGEKGGRLAGTTYQQIADALATHFGMKISKRSAWDYVRSAREQARASGKELATKGRGAPSRRTQSITEPVKRPRGRPRKPPSAKAPASKVPGAGSSDEVEPPRLNLTRLQSQIACEAMVLTGLPPSSLHRLLKCTHLLKGARSNFYTGLKKLACPLPQKDPSAERPKQDLDHSLRLHQVTLLTPQDQWCALLLAYDPRTHYLNAAMYVLSPESGSRQRVGRPPLLKHDVWAATLNVGQEHVHIQLSAQTILDFAGDTRAKMAVPVDTVWLSPSLGNIDALVAGLSASEPDGRFFGLSAGAGSYLPPEVGKQWSTKQLGKKLAELLNRHNREITLPLLRHYRKRLDDLVEKGRVTDIQLRWLQEAGLLDQDSDLRYREKTIRDIRLSLALQAYWQDVDVTPHRGIYLKIEPIYVKAEWRGVNRSIT